VLCEHLARSLSPSGAPRAPCNWSRSFVENQAANSLIDLVPDAADWTETIRVIDFGNGARQAPLWLNADALQQRVLCYLERE